MLPQYKKDLKIQMIKYINWILNASLETYNKYDQAKASSINAMRAVASEDYLMKALDYIGKEEKDLATTKYILADFEQIKTYKEKFDQKYKDLVIKLEGKVAYRDHRIDEAIFFIVAGFALQLLSTVPC